MSDLVSAKKAILEEATDEVIEYMVEESEYYEDREEWIEEAVTTDFLTVRKLSEFQRWLENE